MSRSKNGVTTYLIFISYLVNECMIIEKTILKGLLTGKVDHVKKEKFTSNFQGMRLPESFKTYITKKVHELINQN